MAKNPPLVGHFPVQATLNGQPTFPQERGIRGRGAAQEPAFTLKMNARSGLPRSGAGLALVMLWKRLRESMFSKKPAPGRARSCLTSPPIRAYSVRLGWLPDKARWFEAFNEESAMALDEWSTRRAGPVGMRAELHGAGVYTGFAPCPRERSWRKKSEGGAKGELPPASPPERLNRDQLAGIAFAFPPSSLPLEIPCPADHQRVSARRALFPIVQNERSWVSLRPARSRGEGSRGTHKGRPYVFPGGPRGRPGQAQGLLLPSLSGEAQWNVCSVTRESV